MNQNPNILSQPEIPVEMLQNLREQRDAFPEMEARLQRAEQAGIDVSDQKTEFEKAKARILQILAVYDK